MIHSFKILRGFGKINYEILTFKKGIGLEGSIVIYDKIIQKRLLSFHMTIPLLQIQTPAGWDPRAVANGNTIYHHLNTLMMEGKCFSTSSAWPQ